MRQRPESNEKASEDLETVATPSPGGSASSFDAAQGLLQAAIDEIRASGSGTADRPPVEDGDRSQLAAPTSFPPPLVAPMSAPPRAVPASAPPRPASPAAAPAPPASSPRPAGAAQGPGATGFWGGPAVRQPTDAKEAGGPALTPGTRRRRTPTRPAPLTEDTDDFESLTDALFQPSTKGKGRRRRPDSETATALAATAAASATPSTGAPSPVAEVRTQPPLWTNASPTTAPATSPASKPDRSLDTMGVLDPVLREPSRSPTAATEQWDSAPRRRTPWIVAAAIVAAVALAGLGLVLTSSGDSSSDKAAVVARGKAQLRFDPITTPEGATVTRTWELGGRRGSEFVGTLSFSNPTSAPVQTVFTEVIPKSLASSVTQITFDPQPIVIKVDPVVQYRLTVPAGSTTTATYAITVAPDGVDRSRLEAWAKDLPTATTTTTTTTTAPALLPTTEATTVPTSAPGRANSGNTGGGSTNRPSNPSNPPSPTTPPTSPPEPPPTSPPEPPPTNPPVVKGTIVIQVITRGSQAGTFGYSTPFGAISLTTSGGGASWAAEIDSGAYTLAQISTPDFFYLYEIRCSNGFASSNTTTASITVQPGATTSCTFENRPA